MFLPRVLFLLIIVSMMIIRRAFSTQTLFTSTDDESYVFKWPIRKVAIIGAGPGCVSTISNNSFLLINKCPLEEWSPTENSLKRGSMCTFSNEIVSLVGTGITQQKYLTRCQSRTQRYLWATISLPSLQKMQRFLTRKIIMMLRQGRFCEGIMPRNLFGPACKLMVQL